MRLPMRSLYANILDTRAHQLYLTARPCLACCPRTPSRARARWQPGEILSVDEDGADTWGVGVAAERVLGA